MNRGKRTNEKTNEYLFKILKKRVGLYTRTYWCLLAIPSTWSVVLLWACGLLYSCGFEHWECSSGVNKDTGRFVLNLEKRYSKPIKRKGWEQPLYFLRASSFEIRRTWKDWLECWEHVKWLNLWQSLSVFWLFAIIAETGFLVLYKSWKLRILMVLP